MATKLELYKEAQGQVAINPKNALQLFNRCATEFPEELNGYDALGILTFMRSTLAVDLKLANELATKFNDIKILNIYGWLIFDHCIKKKELKEIQNFELQIEKASQLVHQKNLQQDSTYPCPITISIFKIVDSYSDVSFNAEKVKNWLSKLRVEFLSTKTTKINTPKGEIELASDFEKYNSLMSKAFFKLGEFKQCLELSKNALSAIKNFHFNNDLWFKMRIALSEENLGNHEESERILVELLESKEGGDKWFLYRDIAEIYFDQNENEKAWKYAVDSAFYGNEPHFLINLFLLQARILYKLQRTEKIELLAYLVASIVKDQGWRIKSEQDKLIQYYRINMNDLKPTLFYFKEAQKFWVQERYKGKELISGKITSVIPNGKAGQIIDDKGIKYKFSKKFIVSKVRNLNDFKGCEVTFFKMKGLENKLSAEFITILEKEVKSKEVAASSDLVGKEYNGTVGAVVEFGVFIKLTGLRDGLLHVNNMPQDLKLSYKDRLVKGQNIKVQIVKVSEKGIELKYIK